MLKQKFVFAVSLIAMVTVGVGSARADIASTVYVQQGVNSAKTAASAAQTSANNANTAAGAAQTSADNAQAAAEAAQASADSAAASAKTANDAIAGLDLTQVGADGSYIKTVKQVDGKVTATAEAADTTPTASSKKMVTSGGVYTALSGKQPTLTTSNIKGAGSVSVGISNGVITVTGTDNNTTYSTGTASTAGLTKLYTGTGSGTDGTMTQSAITTALNGKLSTSGTAAKATADASGNNIVDTYATKTALSDGLALKEDVSNKANAITQGMDKEESYPTVALMETQISTANNNLGLDVQANTQAIAAMDLAQVGADGSYIKTVKQADGKVTATAEAADTTPTASSEKMVTSGGVYTALSGKQATLTTSNIKGAGSVSVGISNGVITVTGTDNDTKYTLPAATSSTLGGVKIGSNISNSSGTISVPAASSSALGVVKTGTNISNSSGTISVATANGSTLGVVKAGTNVSISSGAVSVATGTPSTLGVVKVGQIPSGSATSTTYATIWVE
ncbi:MAG: hypothetical protein E7009_03335 [Alphaproteobacteria bacterium]|nr:hypothetical protein [Alphaproteobacteria bacterium]